MRAAVDCMWERLLCTCVFGKRCVSGLTRVDLVKDVLAQTPEAKGRLLIDLINEPDGYTLTWEVRLPLPSF